MNSRYLLLASALGASFACNSGDKCERAIRKAEDFVRKRDGDFDVAEEIARCRKRIEPRRIHAEFWQKRIDCILASDGKEGIVDCLDGAPVEAGVVLRRIEQGARHAYETARAFPVGTTPRTSADSECNALPPDWSHPVWSALGVDFIDNLWFRYQYTGDGATFRAEAIGDLDCDGVAITYTLTGTVIDGKPSIQLQQPQPSDD